MHTKVKKVSYCDFCNKHSLRSLADHEKHCTANPDRQCRVCDNAEYDSLPDLIEKFKSKVICDEETGVAECPQAPEILDAVGGCPACAFAIIRCAGMNRFPFETGFKFQEEMKKWWDCVNEKNYQNELNSEIYY